jgi:hypothetical protein
MTRDEMTTMEFVKNREYTLEHFPAYIGKLGNESLMPLPNAEAVDPLMFLNNLAAVGRSYTPVHGYSRGDDGRNKWTYFFLTTHMGRALDGGGYAVVYNSGRYIDGKHYETPIVRRFALCKHEVEDHPGANHSRGWHPGHCKKCGFDMTYDSGD